MGLMGLGVGMVYEIGMVYGVNGAGSRYGV